MHCENNGNISGTRLPMTEKIELIETGTVNLKDQPAGLKSPTVISLHLAGWLVFICLGLPLCRGCGGTVQTPIDALNLDSTTNFGDLISIAILLGSYGNGLLTAILVSVAAWMVSERLWRFTFSLLSDRIQLLSGDRTILQLVFQIAGGCQKQPPLAFRPRSTLELIPIRALALLRLLSD